MAGNYNAFYITQEPLYTKEELLAINDAIQNSNTKQSEPAKFGAAEANKKLPTHVQNLDHPFGKYYLTEASIKKMLPLLSMLTYINKIDIFNNQKIDIDLNFFRELPISFNIDSVRWYFHLTGIHAELDKP